MAEPTGLSASIWLFLLKEGGHWSAADIAKELSDHPVSVAALMKSMVVGGLVRRVEKGAGERVRFGVTGTCKVPRGVTLNDILACDVAPFAKEAA